MTEKSPEMSDQEFLENAQRQMEEIEALKSKMNPASMFQEMMNNPEILQSLGQMSEGQTGNQSEDESGEYNFESTAHSLASIMKSVETFAVDRKYLPPSDLRIKAAQLIQQYLLLPDINPLWVYCGWLLCAAILTQAEKIQTLENEVKNGLSE